MVEIVPPARIVFSADDRRQILSRIDNVLISGRLTLGPNTEELEAKFSVLHGDWEAVAVSSGTAALEILLRIWRCVGRSVIVPANTFAATAFSVVHAGAIPVFADVDPFHGMVTVESIQAAMTEDVSAVIVVHIGGMINPQIREIAQFCAQNKVLLLEDAAHAHGCMFAGRAAGTFGHGGAFSLYPTKVVTSGEGGIVLCDSKEMAALARVYRDQGKSGFSGNQIDRLGYNWRMSELNAAVGCLQVARLPEFVSRRGWVAKEFDRALSAVSGIVLPSKDQPGLNNYYKYVVVPAFGLRFRFRSDLKAKFKERGVSLSGEVYDRPLTVQPAFRSFSHSDAPGAARFCQCHVCLPVLSDMTDDEVNQVSSVAAELLAGV